MNETDKQNTAQTLYDKLWRSHVVQEQVDGSTLLYIDRHYIHEVTSAQAFEGLRLAGRTIWRPDSIIATTDHNIPTKNWHLSLQDPFAAQQLQALDQNVKAFKISHYFPYRTDERQGVVHVMGPQLGASLPGMTVVCGDSHTSTHGAFAALAYGIGTSEVEHVLATQCLVAKKAKNMRINITGQLANGISAKDMALYIIGQLGCAVGTGYTIEFSGEAVRALTMESRMTLCNMAIEMGARSGLIAVDAVTLDYLKQKPMAPQKEDWHQAVSYWQTLHSDEHAHFDVEYYFDAADIGPQITWGTSPEMVITIGQTIPKVDWITNEGKRHHYERALQYMGLISGIDLREIPVDVVFIGSCTNGRIEDIRAAAAIARGRKKAANVKRVLVVPGSGQVKAQAEKEGLAEILLDAGFEWREPGCSMCLAMNEDKLDPRQRCASTSNRNFEGRQGTLGRTHLMSPQMAAAAAVTGYFTDHRLLLFNEKR